MNEVIHIAVGFDNNFVIPCGVTLYSICRNTLSPIVFHAIVASDVTAENKGKISNIVKSSRCSIQFYTIDETIFENLPENYHIRKSTYNRLLIPKLLSKDISKVIYLDSDIIVDAPLDDLWNIKLEHQEPLAAAMDAKSGSVLFHNAIDIPLSQTYFNAGVLLMNLDCWRKEDLGEKCINYITQTQCKYMDQDAINAIMGSRIKRLHTRYNLQAPFFTLQDNQWEVEKIYFHEVKEAIANATIVHYSETQKPWREGYPVPELWLHYLKQSPFHNVSLEPIVQIANGSAYRAMLNAQLIDDIQLDWFAPPFLKLFELTVNKHPKILALTHKIICIINKLLQLHK